MRRLTIALACVLVLLVHSGCRAPEQVVRGPSRWESALVYSAIPLPLFLPLTLDHVVAVDDREILGFHGPVHTIVERVRVEDVDELQIVYSFGRDGRLIKPLATISLLSEPPNEGTIGGATTIEAVPHADAGVQLIEAPNNAGHRLRIQDERNVEEFEFNNDGVLVAYSLDDFEYMRLVWNSARTAFSFEQGLTTQVTLDPQGRIETVKNIFAPEAQIDTGSFTPPGYLYRYRNDHRGNWVSLKIELSFHDDRESVPIWLIEREFTYWQ